MNVQLQSFLGKNDEGESIFGIEMVNIDCSSWLQFKCDIIIEYDKHPTMRDAIAQLNSPETTPENEMKVIQEILSQVTTIEGIKNCKVYENNTDLKSPSATRFNKFLITITLEKGAEQMLAFSARKNPDTFMRVRHKLSPHVSEFVETNRIFFEAMIEGHPDLQEEYVQYYSPDAKFYVVSADRSSMKYLFFLMVTDQISFFFFGESS